MILLWLSTILLLCDSYKILVMNPKYAYSHMNFMGKIADTLVEAGHEVVTFQPIIEPLHVGNGTTKSRVMQCGPYAELAPEMDILRNGNHLKPLWTASATNPVGVIAFVPMLSSMTEKALTNVLDDKDVLQQLKKENFDVAIAELFDFIGIGTLEAIGLKNIVGAHTCALMEGTSLALGVPVLPSFMPASLGVTNDSTDLWTRATNLLFTCLSWYFQTGIASAADRVMKKKLGPNVTPVWDTVSNISWVLVNSEPLMEFEGPTLRKIIDIGGIGVHEPKPLDEEWNRILNLRKQTILISFGTVAQSKFMPESMKKAIINVVKSFPNITFIWKYEEPNDAMFKGIDNLIASEWTPQSCLLADKRLTLFITHGGAGSMMESALRAKPLIVVPLFGDQTRNAKLMEKFGFGVLVEKARLLNSNVLRSAIERILNDSKYQTAATRMSRLLARRPFSPGEKLVKTVELAAEFGNLPELRAAGRNLGYIAYYNLDLLLVIAAFSVIFTVFLLYIIHRVFVRFFITVKVKVQ